MADPFIAEIRVFPFKFAPRGWAFCDGQLMPISQNSALFSILGATYGGDGKSTYALPDLRGRVPMHPGGAGHALGEQGGSETVALLSFEMPSHTHAFSASLRPADSLAPSAVAPGTGNNAYVPAAGAVFTAAAAQALVPAGESMPHNNLQPYLALNFCIALQGEFPPRS